MTHCNFVVNTVLQRQNRPTKRRVGHKLTTPFERKPICTCNISAKITISDQFVLLYYGKQGSSEFLTPQYNLPNTPKLALLSFLNAKSKAGESNLNPLKLESLDIEHLSISTGGETEHSVNIDLPQHEGVDIFWELARTIGKRI